MAYPSDAERDRRFKELCDQVLTEAIVKLLQALCVTEESDNYAMFAKMLSYKEHEEVLKLIMITSAFMLTDMLRAKTKELIESN